MQVYDHKKIEKKWQKFWDGSDLYQAEDFSDKPKYYYLIEFPYPSGEGLHVGHPRSYTALDIMARKKRMEGYNVLYPIGFDAFGLPAENYAIKQGIHPAITTKKNIATFTRQLKSLGLSFDWSRAVNTTDPKYYRWTQWIFVKLFERGLAYKAKMPINWCLSCKIGLANEEVVNGRCERCGGPVEKREKEQWMLRITQYADRLIDDLAQTEYWDKIKQQQINWIGRSEGAEIEFPVVFTGTVNQGFKTLVNSAGKNNGKFYLRPLAPPDP
ncbi:class I tRNA ligase family protein, partial [Candidatus Falkowbacteria bacterium]|nr:class I tRNA ligase family protein [Candidatus Falkowbacteria bacterium]